MRCTLHVRSSSVPSIQSGPICCGRAAGRHAHRAQPAPAASKTDQLLVVLRLGRGSLHPQRSPPRPRAAGCTRASNAVRGWRGGPGAALLEDRADSRRIGEQRLPAKCASTSAESTGSGVRARRTTVRTLPEGACTENSKSRGVPHEELPAAHGRHGAGEERHLHPPHAAPARQFGEHAAHGAVRAHQQVPHEPANGRGGVHVELVALRQEQGAVRQPPPAPRGRAYCSPATRAHAPAGPAR